MGRWLSAGTSLTPRQVFWSGVAGGALAIAVLVVAGALWSMLPPPMPLVVGDAVTSYPAPGVWRVQTTNAYTTECETTVVSRTFAADGVLWTQKPLRSGIIDAGGKREVDMDWFSTPAVEGKRTVWAEYEMTRPVAAGTYIIEVQAWGCANGWNGSLPPRTVPFSWGMP